MSDKQTPNSELQALISGMRGTAQGAENDDNEDCATVLRSYADELEALIDDDTQDNE